MLNKIKLFYEILNDQISMHKLFDYKIIFQL